MAERRKKQEASGGAPEWIVTFSDLMSLLLTFFVLLLSFSTVSEKDFNEAMSSVQVALGVLDKNMGLLNPTAMMQRERGKQAERTARRLRRQLQVLGMEQQVKMEFDAVGGLKISLPGSLLFDAGSASLKPDALPALREIAGVLKDLPETFIEVRGHTDMSPLNASGGYRDNYDLSYQRAHSVFEQLAGPGRVPVQQFEITASGASQPAAPNDSEAGRQANRRVEIYVRGFVDESKVNKGQGAESMAPEEALLPLDAESLEPPADQLQQ